MSDINQVSNIRATPKIVHEEINSFYNRPAPFTNGKTVRDWLTGQSYEFQFKFGLERWKILMTKHGYPID